MAERREERANQALRDSVAEFLVREAGPQSLITVTRAEVSSNFLHATLYLTVLPEEKEAAALALARRSIPELKKFIEERVRLPRMPHIDFYIDRGQKNADRLEELS